MLEPGLIGTIAVCAFAFVGIMALLIVALIEGDK
jgi:hypothetical protein